MFDCLHLRAHKGMGPSFPAISKALVVGVTIRSINKSQLYNFSTASGDAWCWAKPSLFSKILLKCSFVISPRHGDNPPGQLNLLNNTITTLKGNLIANYHFREFSISNGNNKLPWRKINNILGTNQKQGTKF
ncbi:hypothetical protein PR048_010501 [Dryococelus australis]|uniref:Uncharacterized protein n=1 Tax=Dryococelus australis TaxID=614101 RepID=A0ABQ9I3D1_9NEOP|nr:hypothetical protein PR048_010501 [Dryococelus australis]